MCVSPTPGPHTRTPWVQRGLSGSSERVQFTPKGVVEALGRGVHTCVCVCTCVSVSRCLCLHVCLRKRESDAPLSCRVGDTWTLWKVAF